ncbi:hypothetical protein FD755_015346 [Muntiacus reevesi]|uniref:Neuregulin 2 N-terminal domain-containing protein n=1 Tax=Muntiacus reevesi TaxID=9886 RepID=A0A5N3XKR2_MUNRE|nr:hypothetical protein FD755_015346 [Muntiacus reevesi]
MSWRCAPRRAGRTGPAARSPPPSPLLLPPLLLLWTAALAPGAAAGDEAAPAGASVCYASPPSVGSVQELAQRAAVVIEGKLHPPRRRQQGALDREAAAAAAAGEAGAWGGERPPPANGTVPAWPSGPAPSAAEPGAEAPYLVKVHQVWAAKAGGLKKDSLLTVRLGAWGHPAFPSCGRLKEDSRYIFFMEPEANSSGRAPAAFRASFPPLETGRNLKKEVSRVLCKRCVCSSFQLVAGDGHLFTFLIGICAAYRLRWFINEAAPGARWLCSCLSPDARLEREYSKNVLQALGGSSHQLWEIRKSSESRETFPICLNVLNLPSRPPRKRCLRVILAWESPWQRSLAGYSPWGRKELDMTERLTLPLSSGY